MKKTKKIKAWAVICSKEIGLRAFTEKLNAKAHCDFLNKEYSPECCRHKVIPCEVIIKEK